MQNGLLLSLHPSLLVIENPWTGKEHFAQLPKKLFSCQLEQFVFTVFVLVTFLTSPEGMRLVSSENLFHFEPV